MRVPRVVPRIALVLAALGGGAQGAERIACTYGGHPVTLVCADAATAKGVAPAVAGAAAGAASAASATAAIAGIIDGRPVTLTGGIAIGLAPGASAAALAARLGLEVERSDGTTAILRPAAGAPLAGLRALPLAAAAGVRWCEPVVATVRHPRSDPTDPLFAQQWHLRNNGPAQVANGVAGNDLDAVPAWNLATGEGVRVAIVDTGVELTHPDLSPNIAGGEGHDFIDADGDPSPGSESGSGHGTMVAGLVAAARNGSGVVGVAYDALLVPLRLIGEVTTTTDAADAFRWHHGLLSEVQVENNSWGPDDDGRDDGAVIEEPSSIELQALADGFTLGRGGLGTTYVWAAGNGGGSNDTCDRDGYANSRYVISVGASNADGLRSYYSEMGACLFVNAPVGASGVQQARTTVVGGGYGTGIGTSFAAPMVCGVVALMLEADPDLGTRDVRDILARTAVMNDPADANWLTNGAGLHWNLKYGFGRVDATAAVTLAQGWTALPAEAVPLGASASPAQAIQKEVALLTAVPLTIGGDARFRAEAVELTIDATHPRQGDLAFTLTSPRGTGVTFLARAHDTAAARVWTLSSVATWGEDPRGIWTVVARDVGTGPGGTLNGLTLTVHGHFAASAAAPGTGTASGGSLIVGADGTTAPPAPAAPPEDDDDDGGSCGLGGLAVLVLLSCGVSLRSINQRRPGRRPRSRQYGTP